MEKVEEATEEQNLNLHGYGIVTFITLESQLHN